MLNKVIFLDFDGVLNSPAYQIQVRKESKVHPDLYKKNSFLIDFDPVRIAVLAWTARKTGAKIVPISSWRNNKDAIAFLKRAGLPIIGVTPTLNKPRGEEIAQWIKDKGFEGKYVILDDESSEYNDEQLTHLIYTREGYSIAPEDDVRIGLQPKHLNFITSILGGKNVK